MTIELADFENPPSLALAVSSFWKEMNDGRQQQLNAWSEVRKFIYATDTTHTTAITTPWRNKTTRNKLSWIHDKLITHYSKNLMPNEDFFRWKADEDTGVPNEMALRVDEYQKFKVRSKHVRFTEFLVECLDDYVSFGNTFANYEFIRRFRKDIVSGEEKLVFQGAKPIRIPPQNVVFDAALQEYVDASICVREIKERVMFLDNIEPWYDLEVVEKLRDLDFLNSEIQDWIKKNHLTQDGTDYLRHVKQGKIELFRYYGHMFNLDTKEWVTNSEILIADHLFVLGVRPIQTFEGIKPVVFSKWRNRTDNLWGQGPLEQIVGLQYRIDHIENLKADSTDMMGMPVIVVKGEGMEEEFTWEPGITWHIPPNAEIEILYPDPKILLFNEEILTYERSMEELAGVPRETAGFRTPGEKTAFEVDQLLSHANIPFEEKLIKFENEFLEPLLNLMLELNLTHIDVDDLRMIFPEDILPATDENIQALKESISVGRLFALGSKHFKAQQKKIQEVQALIQIALSSPQTAVHLSSINALLTIQRELGAEDDGLIKFGAGLEEQIGLKLLQEQLEKKFQQQQGELNANAQETPAAEDTS